MELEHALKKYTGYTSFREGQEEIIRDLVSGRNVVAMLPTGGGKSLCYQLPAYLLKGAAVIISPLLALMEDQVAQLKMNGEKNVIALNSFLDYEEKQKALSRLSDYRFIFLSPESLNSAAVIKALKQIRVGLLAVDEAHCISQWGHDFRPDYSLIGEARQMMNEAPCLALTATATSDVVSDIKESLHIPDAVQHLHSVNRPNIAMFVKEVSGLEEKLGQLSYYVQSLKGPGLIYCSGRQWTEKLSAFLKEKGISRTAYYHGGMEKEQRMLIQQQYLNGQLDLVCCTSAFGMGVNKQDIRYVIHFHLAARMDAYLQEIGRAGRDGMPAAAITLYDREDIQLPLFMIEKEFPAGDELKAFLAAEEDSLSPRLVIEETHERFILHHLRFLDGLTREEKEEAIRRKINERQQNKTEKLMNMIKWYSTDVCKRTGILNYFGEGTIRPDFDKYCCSSCGADESFYFESSHTDRHEHDRENHWRSELGRMFKVSEPIVQKP